MGEEVFEGHTRWVLGRSRVMRAALEVREGDDEPVSTSPPISGPTADRREELERKLHEVNHRSRTAGDLK